MLKFFHRLKVSQKLALISVLFMIPDTVLLCLFLISINANIRFAQWEKYGNAYQRPLEALLNDLHNHLLTARHKDAPHARTLAEVRDRIEAHLQNLAAVDAELAVILQFTDDGLAKRQREHYRVANVQAEWQELKTNLDRLNAKELAERHLHLIADVRTMITHVGDASNLILDPDLDSYYLMDVTLLALPQMQDRLGTILAHGEAALQGGTMSPTERRQLAVYAALLQEADLDRVVASTRTALNEDANFHGRSESMQHQLPVVLENFSGAAEKFIGLLFHLSEAEQVTVTPEAFVASGLEARSASFALWTAATEELDMLLAKRVQYYQTRRAKSLVLTALALTAAISFVGFITHSISRPLQKHAAELSESNSALQAEILERHRVEVALRGAEEKYRGIFENAVEGIFQTTPEGRYRVANPQLARIYGYASVEELQASVTDIGARLYVDPARREEFQRLISRYGQLQRFESQVYRKDRTIIWISEHVRAVCAADGTLQYYEGTVEDITERKRNEAELERVHRELVDASRLAGMAEVATGVLHNVGNVLNSVNVSTHFIADRLRKSKVADLPRIAALLRENAGALGQFLSTDPKGKQLPGYIGQLAEHLTQEQNTLVKQTGLLREHLDHIKEIVAMQQNYAKVSGVLEPVQLAELVEDALRMQAGALSRHQVEVIRQYQPLPPVSVDRHKVLQILVNLFGNAKYACSNSGRMDKRVTVQTFTEAEKLKIVVSDNGVGIPNENLIRIFSHGFTTKKDGHGFGLHSGALAAKEMGGSLQVHSAGVGQGASFILELPLQLQQAAA